MAQLKDTTITGNIAVSGTANITGGGQSNGSITLYSASGDSPSLIFQRGTASDTLNDYKIYDTGGYLKIKQAGNSGTSGYTQVAELTNAGKLTVSTPPATDTTPSVSAWISPTDSAIKISGTAITPASGDYIPLSDSSNSNVVSRGIAIGSDTTKYLRNDGTWQTVSGGGGGDVFWVELSYDDLEEEWSIDCTYSDISTAYTAGKAIYMKLSGQYPYDLQDAIAPLVASYWPELDEHTQEYVDGPFIFQFYRVDSTSLIVEVWTGYVAVTETSANYVKTTKQTSTTAAYYSPLLKHNSSTLDEVNTTIDYSNSIQFRFSKGTTSNPGVSALFLGNGTNAGTNGNQYGYIAMYPQNGNYIGYILPTTTLTANRTLYLPDQSGTLATTDDISTAIGSAIAASY